MRMSLSAFHSQTYYHASIPKASDSIITGLFGMHPDRSIAQQQDFHFLDVDSGPNFPPSGWSGRSVANDDESTCSRTSTTVNASFNFPKTLKTDDLSSL